jgi:hypothetical protein
MIFEDDLHSDPRVDLVLNLTNPRSHFAITKAYTMTTMVDSNQPLPWAI